jgi:hypothetical protein
MNLITFEYLLEDVQLASGIVSDAMSNCIYPSISSTKQNIHLNDTVQLSKQVRKCGNAIGICVFDETAKYTFTIFNNGIVSIMADIDTFDADGTHGIKETSDHIKHNLHKLLGNIEKLISNYRI